MGKPPLVNPQGSSAESIGGAKTTWGSEPSQYPQEEKTIVIPLVAASERGPAQTIVLARWGCRARLASMPASDQPISQSNDLERSARDGDSPVDDSRLARDGFLSIAGHVKSREKLRGPSRKAKYFLATDSEPVP